MRTNLHTPEGVAEVLSCIPICQQLQEDTLAYSRPRFLPWERQSPTVDQVVEQLLADVGFETLRLGTWLGTPRGELIEQAVGLLIHPMYRRQYRLLVEALELAARHQQRTQQRAGLVAVGAVVVVAALASLA